MFFRTGSECEAEARALGFVPGVQQNRIERPGVSSEAVKISFVNRTRSSYALARLFVSWLGSFDSCILWITEYGIWPSSENKHLYYRLRSSFHDHRLLRDAPRHLFLRHEQEDLITFVDLAIQFGWGGFLFGVHADRWMTISHDEWVLVESETGIAAIVDQTEEWKLPCKIIRGPRTLDA